MDGRADQMMSLWLRTYMSNTALFHLRLGYCLVSSAWRRRSHRWEAPAGFPCPPFSPPLAITLCTQRLVRTWAGYPTGHHEERSASSFINIHNPELSPSGHPTLDGNRFVSYGEDSRVRTAGLEAF